MLAYSNPIDLAKFDLFKFQPSKMSKSKDQLLSEIGDKKSCDEVFNRMSALCLKGPAKKRKMKDANNQTVELPQSLVVFQSEDNRQEIEGLNLRWFYSKQAYDLSSPIFISLSNFDPACLLNLANLKRLAIFQMETKVPYQTWLINLSKELVELEIFQLNFNLKELDPEEIRIDLVNLKSFSVSHMEGNGMLRFDTPKLSSFKLNKILARGKGFSRLTFPEKLKHLVMVKYEPTIKQFENLEILECEDDLPEDVLTTFKKLKLLKYVNGPSSESKNIWTKRKIILSILNEKKRMSRTDLVIKFCGTRLENERQLDVAKDAADSDAFIYELISKAHPKSRELGQTVE